MHRAGPVAASWGAVNTRTRASTACAVRVALLVLAAAGFLAMHGVAATDPMAGHVSPLDSHSLVAPVMEMPADPGPGVAAHQGDAGHQHHVDLAACAFILLTVLAGVVLRALGVASAGTSPPFSALVRPNRAPPRTPPVPIFLCLCVFRL